VLFDKYAGAKINVDGTDYLIVKEEDILGVFEK
jgi:chaperonin GroES